MAKSDAQFLIFNSQFLIQKSSLYRIRTDTEWGLKPVPLPVGLKDCVPTNNEYGLTNIDGHFARFSEWSLSDSNRY